MSWQGVCRSHEGHFGARNAYATNEAGLLYPDCMFGTNHVSLLANIPKYGNFQHGVAVKAVADQTASTS